MGNRNLISHFFCWIPQQDVVDRGPWLGGIQRTSFKRSERRSSVRQCVFATGWVALRSIRRLLQAYYDFVLFSGLICELEPEFGEFGVYDLTIGKDDCHITTVREPVNIYLPLLICALGLALIWVICSLVSFLISKWIRHRKTIILPTSSQQTPPTTENKEIGRPSAPQRQRLKSLDTFRGISIVLMIFVNDGAGGYWFLEHAPWNGLQIADVLFPWFMWIMGVCIPISIKSQLKKNVPRSTMMVAVIRRACILFLLGLILNSLGGSKLETLRIFGVLQRGYLGPGGIQDNGQFEHCIGGATGYVDRMVLGKDHIYQYPTADEIYQAGPFDPEGIVGCLLSIFQVFLGVQAGTTLSFFREWKQRIKRWLIWGTITGIVAAILCLASKEDGWIPVNKNLWSLSFVLVTSSFAFFLLAACYFLIDVKGWWGGTPFFYPGMNATIMYVGHSVASQMFPWHWSIGYMNTHFMQLVESLWGTGLWILVALWLYHIKFFLSL
ncbi:hypothetical protein C0J52_15490 [Blattella germanica]|nr:hypothetical protein C0J52_15490 [Blattella germanica]